MKSRRPGGHCDSIQWYQALAALTPEPPFPTATRPHSHQLAQLPSYTYDYWPRATSTPTIMCQMGVPYNFIRQPCRPNICQRENASRNASSVAGLVAPGLGRLQPDTTGSSHSGRPASDFSTFPLISNIS